MPAHRCPVRHLRLARKARRLLSATLGFCLLPGGTLASEGYPPPPGSYPLGPAWQTAHRSTDPAPDAAQAQRPGLLLPRNDGQDALNGGLGSTLFGAQPPLDARPTVSLPAPAPTPLPGPAQYPSAGQREAPRSDFSVDFSRRQRTPATPPDNATPFMPGLGPQSYAPYPAQGYGPRSPAPGYSGAEPHYPPSPMSTFRESVLAPTPTHAQAPAQATRFTGEPNWNSDPVPLPAPRPNDAIQAAPAPGSAHAPMFRPPDLSAD